MGLTGRSHAHLEASIAVLVLVETLVSHASSTGWLYDPHQLVLMATYILTDLT